MNTNMKGGKIFGMIMLLGAIILLGSNIVIAGTYYVSNNGSASWDSATNINTPCAVSTAFSNARAGDLVYFRGGTYNVPAKNFGNTYRGYYNPSNSGTGNADSQRIIFKAYTDEVPVFDGTAGGSADVPVYATIFGTDGADYITFDGFTFQADGGTKMARVVIGGQVRSDYVILKNCVINGGTDPVPSADTDNREGLRIENAYNLVVQGCTIYNCDHAENVHNTSAIKTYDSAYITISNCEIYNCAVGVYYKRQTNYTETSYNFIHDCYEAVLDNPGSSYFSMNDHTYHNNLIINCDEFGLHISTSQYFNSTNYYVYNNTIYNCKKNIVDSTSTEAASAINHRYYNNITVNGSVMEAGYVGDLQECDYNQYGANSFRIYPNQTRGELYDGYVPSLAEWQASRRVTLGSSYPDVNGYASDPKFVNTSRNMNRISDFALANDSPCKGAGKEGVDIGANIARIGVGSGNLDTQPPQPPVGVIIDY